ncbi:MAG: hypothetical protein AAGU10_10415 [Methanosarcina mazei]|uniref:hypothetical protein n=1 Tax=Methanosarcina mazei TaxID=2209 RepID=UPI0012D4ACF1|nr:hypothetical protein [Methanosarcina mazei]
MDYRKSSTDLLDKLKISGANVDASTWRLKERVSDTHNRCKLKLSSNRKNPNLLLNKIEFGKDLKEIPDCFLPLVLRFVGYLASTSTFSFKTECRKHSGKGSSGIK